MSTEFKYFTLKRREEEKKISFTAHSFDSALGLVYASSFSVCSPHVCMGFHWVHQKNMLSGERVMLNYP